MFPVELPERMGKSEISGQLHMSYRELSQSFPINVPLYQYKMVGATLLHRLKAWNHGIHHIWFVVWNIFHFFHILGIIDHPN